MCVVLVAVKLNQTSSSSVPPQVFGSAEAVAPINEPLENTTQAVPVFTGVTVALIHASFAIMVLNAFTFDHKLISEAEHIDRT